jgi:hypothetical protein
MDRHPPVRRRLRLEELPRLAVSAKVLLLQPIEARWLPLLE